MPLPADQKLVAVAENVIQQFDTIFGVHPGFRPAHAKGAMLSGTFSPSPQAASLTRAPHFHQASTPVTVRFSNSTGIPRLPDNDPNADPRGMAVRFHLGERRHTDIVGHSVDAFPTHTGEEFLEMLRALAASDPKRPSDPGNPSPIERFLGSHPAALQFVQMPKPAPSSFARDAYFGVSAFRFTNGDGISRFGRYRIVPAAGTDFLNPATLASRGPDYLFDELRQRISQMPIAFGIKVQLAVDGDNVEDSTVRWPSDRPILDVGTVSLTEFVADGPTEERHIIFDPIPRVDGIEPSKDPLLELRAAVYLISGRRRRAAAVN